MTSIPRVEPNVSQAIQEEQTNVKQKKKHYPLASIGALVGSSAISYMSQPIANKQILPAMRKTYRLPQDTIDIIHDGARQALEESGLKAKGVRIRYLDGRNYFAQIIKTIMGEQRRKQPLKEFLDAINIEPIRQGMNAGFVNKNYIFKDFDGTKKLYLKKNSILMPKNDISGAVFHEMGHAMNYNFSKIGKVLQKARPIAMVTPGLIALYGACSKKNDSKANNFVRDHAGLLAFASTVPMLIEEGMATIKGQKYANKLLPKEIAAKVLKGNKIAYCSYALVGILSGLSAFTAVKIKDHFVNKKN